MITASAAGCNGPVTAAHTVTTNSNPAVSFIATATCIGGATGSITLNASGGVAPYTYNINSGSYQTSDVFASLAAGNYTVNVKSNSGCITATTVVVNSYGNSSDDQNMVGTNTWIGHMYSGINFGSYIGRFTEPEIFDETFGGGTTCFNVVSGATTSSIFTEKFSVKFRMNSTKRGLYIADWGLMMDRV